MVAFLCVFFSWCLFHETWVFIFSSTFFLLSRFAARRGSSSAVAFACSWLHWWASAQCLPWGKGMAGENPQKKTEILRGWPALICFWWSSELLFLVLFLMFCWCFGACLGASAWTTWGLRIVACSSCEECWASLRCLGHVGQTVDDQKRTNCAPLQAWQDEQLWHK